MYKIHFLKLFVVLFKEDLQKMALNIVTLIRSTLGDGKYINSLPGKCFYVVVM